ncbi:RDD family protein [Gracilibacillus massiliensis]|uniref:RDD family protein n=1 Tax=Gracilibacillus massiliensis TaxID=1564956 RepID=UPI00071C3704|nr:RDD family protein [Gracilibacillus massiliensis]
MEQEKLGVKTPEYVSLQFQLAGLGSRSAAHIIDYAIIMFTQLLIILFLLLAFTNSVTNFFLGAGESLVFAIVLIVIFILNFGYFILFEYFWGGRTIGKRILGIRVIQENGHNITLLSSIIRNFVRIIDSLPSAYAVGIILIFAHNKHKRLGDITAGTIVVHEKQKKSRKQKPLDKYIDEKGLSKETLQLESFHLKQFSQKDWRLLQTYVHRIVDLRTQERDQLTMQVSKILLPKIEDQITNKAISNENWLILLYLHLKEEWEY